MRSWESVPGQSVFGGRADSQDRMDQILILAGKR
jgi:hypothetical protein